MSVNLNDGESGVEDDNDYDIIIVGAGLAGLVCAYHILRKRPRLDVLILEANSEIGGRILPQECSDTFHASFLQPHITELLKTLRININQVQNVEDIERIWYGKGGPVKRLPRFYGAEVHNFLQTIEESTLDPRFVNYVDHEDANELAETSVGQLLRRIVVFGYARSLCRAFVSSTCASRNLDDISALWFIVMLNGASGFINRLKMAIGDSNRYFIEGGITTLAKKLLTIILKNYGKIEYANPVSGIKFNDDRAYVFAENMRLKCQFVVVAVPPPMYENIAIQVPPEYRFKTETSYSSGENIFFNITYPDWNNIYTGDIVTMWDRNSNLNIAYSATHGNNKSLVLAGFLAEFNDLQTQEKDVFSTLNECFETTEASVCLNYTERVSSNVEDEMNDSSPMSTMKPTSIVNHIDYLGAPIGRIFFASSEYATNWPGTMDGAIEAGEITAYSILSRIRPQALTFDELRIAMSRRRRRELYSPFKMFAMHYFGLAIHIAVFLSFLKKAYPDL